MTNDDTYTARQLKRAFELLAEEQREQRALADGFWQDHLPRPFGPRLVREVADHDTPVTPADVADMTLAQYSEYRRQTGIRTASAVHGVPEWERPAPDNESR